MIVGADATYSNVSRDWLAQESVRLRNQIADLHRELESEREDRAKLLDALRQKDEAMGVLFERLGKAGIDYSDLIS